MEVVKKQLLKFEKAEEKIREELFSMGMFQKKAELQFDDERHI